MANDKVKRAPLKEVEWKLLSELMKNSRRSDRELARAIGVSQPTVSRVVKKLEKEGYVKEYTMIPWFHKIGYHLLAITFVKLAKDTDARQSSKTKVLTERLQKGQFGFILYKTGMGLGYDAVLISFHEDYASFDRLRSEVKKHIGLEAMEMEVFLTSLDDEAAYLPLTLSILAKHILC